MVSAFSAAVNAIFADRNMAAVASWQPAAGGSTEVRVIRKGPDDRLRFGGATIVASTMVVDLRVSEVAAPSPGDRIVISGETFEIQAPPEIDRERLVWTLNLRPVA